MSFYYTYWLAWLNLKFVTHKSANNMQIDKFIIAEMPSKQKSKIVATSGLSGYSVLLRAVSLSCDKNFVHASFRQMTLHHSIYNTVKSPDLVSNLGTF